MESTLTVVLVILAAIVLLKVAKSIASKLFGVLLIGAIIIGVMYYQGYGPFKQNITDLRFLEDKYCASNGDKDICECIIGLAQNDMTNRFSDEELDSLGEQKLRAAYVLQKSLKATKEEAIACLASKGTEEKYTTFLQDFVPIDNKYLDMIGEKARNLKDELTEELNQFQENKKDIDDKY